MAMFRADDTQFVGGPSKEKIVPWTPVGDINDWTKESASEFLKSRETPKDPGTVSYITKVDNSYLDALLAQINGAWDAQKNYIDAQYNEGIKKISDAYDERFRKQQALYNRNRRDIQRAGRYGGMNGAIIAGLTSAGNTNNNAVTQIGKDKANSMSELRTGYLGNLANLERDKNNFNLQLYKQYL